MGYRAAILLCAGYGTRMGALTRSTPKPLLQVADRPVLDYLLDQLQELPDLGAIHVVSNAHYFEAFKDWADAVPEHVELCVVQMPGREERLGEPLMTDMVALVDKLAGEITALDDRPFAFFGHSMGAIISYEVARRLRATDARQPTHLFLSARAAPQLQNSEPLRFLDNAQFMDRLHQTYGAVPDAIRNSTELQEIFLPILRADVELLETHVDTAWDALDCPITVLGGADDPAISAEMLAGWRERTVGEFVQHEFPGDHFYIHQERGAVLAAMFGTMSSDP